MSKDDPFVRKVPLSVADRAPMKGTIRVERDCPILGEAEGVHAGVWKATTVSGVLSYWKAVDIPSADGTYLERGPELDILQDMWGVPGFPTNWREEKSAGRDWIVRDPAFVIPEDYEPWQISTDEVLFIEQGLRDANRNGWSLDKQPISLAADSETFRLFFMGLASAYKDPLADDTDRWIEWLFWAGFVECAGARSFGHNQAPHDHVYLALSKPLAVLDGFPSSVEIRGVGEQVEIGRKLYAWDWIISPEVLEPEVIERHELTWAWSPIR